MPSLKEIKNRIASVNSTRKITSAMKMVASSKLHHAQVAIQNMLPYENLLENILKSFLASLTEVDSPLTRPHDQVRRIALVVYASNSSLCGGFNANVIRDMQQAVDDYRRQGVADIVVYPIGRKVAERVKKMGLAVGGDFVELRDKPNAEQCARIAEQLISQYINGEIDGVELIYHHFKSAGTQILTRRLFLPIELSVDSIGVYNDRDLSSNVVTAKAQEYLRRKAKAEQRRKGDAVPLRDDFIVEPDMEAVLSRLVPRLLNLMVYTALLDSVASEHAARMVAMQTATDNADDLLRALRLDYNKSRQSAITSELLDIMGGAAAN